MQRREEEYCFQSYYPTWIVHLFFRFRIGIPDPGFPWFSIRPSLVSSGRGEDKRWLNEKKQRRSCSTEAAYLTLGYGTQSFLSFSNGTQWSYVLKISDTWSKWSWYTQTVPDFDTCGELSSRSKRKCSHEDQTCVQRISLEHKLGCRFSVEWQQCSYPYVMWKLLINSFSLFLFFLIT